ncbi:MAG: sulfatase-like hydrolase/transferase [Pigmentiphaga sp.]|nr:sulfatase-like hydrolase/transferase [Pigmentiphaga sp.]
MSNSSKRPNFLFIITDQHRADHLGCYGNTEVRTPHIDSLAARGQCFDRFYVATPVCMPNRASIMTGRLPSVHGARSNGVPLPLDSVTFADVLSANGYHTGLVGKIHLQNMEDKPAATEDPDYGDLTVTPGLEEATRRDIRGPEYQQERRSRWADPDHGLTLPYYGFQHVDLCNHHGDETFGDWLRWAEAEQPGFSELCGPDNATPDERYDAPQAWRTKVPEELYSSFYIADRAEAYLRERAEGDQPFFLQCSFPDPHHPFTPPGKYWDMFDPAEVTIPETCQPPGPDAPPHVRWAHAERAAGRSVLTTPRMFAVSAQEARQILALTYGMIAMVDDAVGRILRTLEDTGLAENTVVIFTSDHGDFMGDHGLMLKGPIHYQGLIRVPFIWSDPAAAGAGRVASLGSCADIAGTVLARAGLAPFNGMQSRNLLPLMRGDTASERRAVLVEEDNQRAYLGFERPVRARTLVTARHRLTLYRDADWGELYDLQEDPQERRNLWADPGSAAVRLELTELLAHQLLEKDDQSPLPTQLA